MRIQSLPTVARPIERDFAPAPAPTSRYTRARSPNEMAARATGAGTPSIRTSGELDKAPAFTRKPLAAIPNDPHDGQHRSLRSAGGNQALRHGASRDVHRDKSIGQFVNATWNSAVKFALDNRRGIGDAGNLMLGFGVAASTALVSAGAAEAIGRTIGSTIIQAARDAGYQISQEGEAQMLASILPLAAAALSAATAVWDAGGFRNLGRNTGPFIDVQPPLPAHFPPYF